MPLLPTLNFGEVTQGHLRLGRDLAQGSTLALANAAQNIAEFAAQQRGFTPCLFHIATVAVPVRRMHRQFAHRTGVTGWARPSDRLHTHSTYTKPNIFHRRGTSYVGCFTETQA